MANSWIGSKARKALYTRDSINGAPICCYCEQVCKVGDTRKSENPKIHATLDHIVPQKTLAAAATDDKHFAQLRRNPKNLVVVCMGCNSSKQHTELYTWCAQTGKNYATILARIAERIAKS